MADRIGYFSFNLYGVCPYEGITLETILKDKIDPNLDIYLFGDIYDRKNCHIKNLDRCNKEFYETLFEFKEKYIMGDKELNRDQDIPLIVDGWGLCHGDWILHGAVESLKRRKYSPGSTYLKRFIESLKIRSFKKDSYQEEFLSYCSYFKIDKGIICGNDYITEKKVITFGDKHLVLYPRGRHLISEI